MKNNIALVVKKKMCLSCGACCSVCPACAINMVYMKKEGFYRPFLNEANCLDCGKCINICPAGQNDNNGLIGNFKSLYLAHATDGNIRHWATSGGVVNTLIRYLLDKEIVEAVLIVGYTKDSPVEAGPYLLTRDNVSILMKNPRDFASRYVTVPVLKQLKELRSFTSVAVVGTSCQVTALKNICVSVGGGL